MTEQLVHTCVAQLIVVRFLGDECVRSDEILVRLRQRFGDCKRCTSVPVMLKY